jgi:hypothetical protein
VASRTERHAASPFGTKGAIIDVAAAPATTRNALERVVVADGRDAGVLMEVITGLSLDYQVVHNPSARSSAGRSWQVSGGYARRGAGSGSANSTTDSLADTRFAEQCGHLRLYRHG